MLRSLALAATVLLACTEALAQIPLDSAPPVGGPVRTNAESMENDSPFNPPPLSPVNPIGALLPVGPDGFGYTLTDDTELGGPNYQFLDIEDPLYRIVAGNDSAASTSFIAPVLFYGSVVQTLQVGTSGYISTDLTDSGSDFSNDPSLPVNPSSGGGARLYPHHDDLSTTVYAAYFPSCPRDAQAGAGYLCNIIQWEGQYYNFGTPFGSVSFQVLIYGNGEIVYQYRTISDGGASATVGLQSEPGFTVPKFGIAYSANTANSIVANRAIRVTSPNTALLVDTADDDQPYVTGNAGSLAECGDGDLDADCTLREAIVVANALEGIDQISLSVLSAGQAIVFAPLTSLPTITDERVSLTGLTQFGSSCGFSTPILTAVIDGSGVAGTFQDGIGIAAGAEDVSINGVSVVNFSGTGIAVRGDRASVTCSLVGIRPDSSAAPNAREGIFVNASSAQIGDADRRNVVSNNGREGIFINGGDQNRVYNNWVGITTTGLDFAGNGLTGIVVTGAATNTIVGSVGTTRNVSSGNGGNGIVVSGAGVVNTRVEGNYVGTKGDPASSVGIANAGSGITVANGAASTVVTQNVVSGNTLDGIRVFGGAAGTRILGNMVGLLASGVAAGNGLSGIAIESAAVEVGDPSDAGTRNVVGANSQYGISIVSSTGTSVHHSVIGLAADGSTARANTYSGIQIVNSTGTQIGSAGAGNTIAYSGRQGIHVNGASSGTMLQANTIGVLADGLTAAGNTWAGIAVEDGSTNTVIGTDLDTIDDELEGNVIAFNDLGAVNANNANVTVSGAGTGTRIRGNYIGATAVPAALGRTLVSTGVRGILARSPDIVIGGDVAEARNVISGNDRAGIEATGASTTGLVVKGNYIGTADDGTTASGNGVGGVILGDGINGSVTQGNTIANNGIGILAESEAGLANSFLANRILDNVGLGIDLGGDGVTANDASDTDGGPNGLQNYPDLVAVEENANEALVDVTFTLDAVVGETYSLDFYRSPSSDPSGHGEGADYRFNLLFSPATAALQRGNRNSVSVSVPDSLRGTFAPGDFISVTATRVTGSEAGSTSEFSNAVPVTLSAASLSIHAILEGAWDPNTSRMRTDLSPPTSQPYLDPIYHGTLLEYDGPEAASAQALASWDIVDWVLIQLRTSTDAASTVTTRAALANGAGTITSASGFGALTFPGVPAGNYFVVVLHRNHLAAMTASPVALPGGFANLSSNPAFGANATNDLGGGFFGLWAGDGNGDGSILADDRQSVWLPQVGQSGYLPGDFNLDGDVLADDRQGLWAPNVGRQSAVPGASLREARDVVVEQ